MSIKSVSISINRLINELLKSQNATKKRGSFLINQGKHVEAEELILKTQKLDEIIGKLRVVKKVWDTPTDYIPSPSELEEVISNNESAAFRRSESNIKVTQGSEPVKEKTSQTDFEDPILESLVELGGSGSVREVLALVEAKMHTRLRKGDYEPIPSDSRVIRWSNTTQWARQNLVATGYLLASTSRGIWEISETGRKRLADKKRRTSLPNLENQSKITQSKNQQAINGLNPEINGKPILVKELYFELRSEILAISENIRESQQKMYTSYKVEGINFVDVRVQSKSIILWIKPFVAELTDPEGLSRDVSSIGHYGNGPTELSFSNISQLKYIMEFVQQSYEKVVSSSRARNLSKNKVGLENEDQKKKTVTKTY